MVNVWMVREGTDPTYGGPRYRVPVLQCIELFGFTDAHFSKDRPQFAENSHSHLRNFIGPRHVVVEIDEGDADRNSLECGYYLLSITPEEAEHRLKAAGMTPTSEMP